MEVSHNEKLPKCVKSLLIDAGYDTILSLNEMDDAKIKKVEDFLNANKQFVNKLKCCYSEHYKQLEKFEFLPGHKSIILALPNQIKENQDKQIKKSRKQRHDLLSNEELQQQLIKSLTNFLKIQAEKANLEIPEDVISEANIHNFETETNGNDFLCTCRFSCPFCSKTYSVNYKTFWMSSNVTKHLKTHVNPSTDQQ